MTRPKPKVRERRARLLAPADLDYILAHASADHRDAVILGIDTGMRIGELASLRREHVDFERGVILLAPENTKSKRPRDIPMTARAKEIISRRLTVNDGRLFRSSAANLSVRFHRERRKMSLPAWRFHDTRGTCATRLLQSGADVYTVMELLGHSKLETVTRYLHTTDAAKRAAIQALEGAA